MGNGASVSSNTETKKKEKEETILINEEVKLEYDESIVAHQLSEINSVDNFFNKNDTTTGLHLLDYSFKLCNSMEDDEFIKNSSTQRNNTFAMFLQFAMSNKQFRLKYFEKENIFIIKKYIPLFHKIFKIAFKKDAFHPYPLYAIGSILWNSTDCSDTFAKLVFENATANLIIKELLPIWMDMRKKPMYLIRNNKIQCPFENLNPLQQQMTLIGQTFFGILHNILRFVDESRAKMREDGIISLIKTILSDSCHITIEVVCNFILAFVINENEKEIVGTNKNVIEFLLNILEKAVVTKEHTYYGFVIDEIVIAANKMAICESNKILMIDLLPLLLKILNEAISDDEQENVAKCLWTLSFDEKCCAILGEEKNYANLKEISVKGRTNKVKRSCKGVLWEIDKSKDIFEISDGDTSNKQGHIMISYQWAYKPMVFRIRDFLRKKGYQVWIDVDSMHGSTLECMAKAVEDSVVVLVCFSKKYKESPSCRSEAEYAYRTNKEIVPLKLEKGYMADGWLGILLGTKLYMDFSKPEKVDKSLEDLVNQLGVKGKFRAIKPIELCDENEAIDQETNNSIQIDDIKTWNEVKVKTFLRECGLSAYVDKFKKWDGLSLIQLKRMSEISPECYFMSMKNEMKMSLLDCMIFTRHLQNLQI